jgi:A/G-specific adenine glycosylase
LAQGNQTDYPNKKPKKILPEKNTIMLMVQSLNSNAQKEVFMLKRPPAGIWGSLWCFPEFDDLKEVEYWLEQHFDAKIEDTEALMIIKHTFSHFRLFIQPLIITCETPINLGVMEKEESLWYNITTEFNGGLAAPVQQLLNTLKVKNNGKNG